MSATGFILFAAALIRRASPVSGSRAEDLRWRFLPTGLYLVVALLLAAAIIALASRWRRAPRSATVSASEQLSEFRLLYEKGQMSRDEFERVKARLGGEIRGAEPVTSPRPAAAQPEPAAATPAAPQQAGAPTVSAPPTPQLDTPAVAASTTPESTAPPPAPPAADGQGSPEEPPESARPA